MGLNDSISDLKEVGLAQTGILRSNDLVGSWVDMVRTDRGSKAAASSFHRVFDDVRTCADEKTAARLRAGRTATATSDDLVSGSDRKIAVSRAQVFKTDSLAASSFAALTSSCSSDRISRTLRNQIDAAPGVVGVTAESIATPPPKAGDAAAGFEIKLTIQTQNAPAPVAFQVGLVRTGRVVSVVMLGAVADPFDTATRDGILTAIAGRVSHYR